MKTCKITFVGDSFVGKTSLIGALREEKFKCNDPTIGASFCTLRKTIGEEEVNLEIWDTAGSERYAPFLHLYLRKSKIIVVCFDSPHRKTIEKHERNALDEEPTATLLYVATKIDFEESKRLYAHILEDENKEVICTSSVNMLGVEELRNKLFELAIKLGDVVEETHHEKCLRIFKEEKAQPPQSQCCSLF